MITGLRADFLRRCCQRGYTLDEVRACIVAEDADTITVDETSPAYPHPRPGLGDAVAGVLASVGVTKGRVSRLLGRPCDCPDRQAALNRIGAAVGLPAGLERAEILH